MTESFDPLPDSGKFDPKMLEGCVVVIAVGGTHEDWPTRYDPKPAVRLSLVAVNGPHAGEEFLDLLMFNAPVVRQFRGKGSGLLTVGRVTIDRSYAWPAVSFAPLTEDEMKLARRWDEEHPGRARQLAHIAEVSFKHNEVSKHDRSQRPMATSVQQQQPVAPRGPNYGQEPAPAAPPPLAPQPQAQPQLSDEPPF